MDTLEKTINEVQGVTKQVEQNTATTDQICDRQARQGFRNGLTVGVTSAPVTSLPQADYDFVSSHSLPGGDYPVTASFIKVCHVTFFSLRSDLL